MRRFLSAFLLSFVLVPHILTAQQGGAQPARLGVPARIGSDAAIVDLLQQSHELNRLLPFQEQTMLLSMQARLVADVRPDLGREWVNELFSLSLQAKPEERPRLQSGAFSVLVRIDPDRALELLHRMDFGDPNSNAD